MATNDDNGSGIGFARRAVLHSLCGLGVALPLAVRSQSAVDAATNLPPQIDDWIVHAYGADEGRQITPANLMLGAKQIFAYPQDPATLLPRNGTRLNQLILIRLDPSELSEQTKARSADGVVAYSGVCSHTGCDVMDWDAEARRFQCPCHESQFDPSDAARVVGGPAPWQLAALPLKLVDGKLAVAGSFEGRLGFQQPGLDPFSLQL